MVQIIQRPPSFGEKIGQGIGAGLSEGFSKASDFASQLGLEKFKQGQRSKLIKDIRGGSQQQSEGQSEEFRQKFIDALPEMEQHLGRDLQPKEVDQLWDQYEQMNKMQNQMQEDPFAEAEAFAAAGEPELSRVSMERGKQASKHREAEIARGYEESKPTRARGRELLEDLPYKENALTTMKEAIQTGNLGMFSLDNLAELTGIEGLRSPEGAAFKTAGKEFFLGNLSRVGSRGLNQMMERVVLEMSPLIGRSTEANLAVTEILNAETDVSRREAELIHDIGQKYKESHGHYPDDLSDRVYKELRPFAQQRQKDALAEVDRIKRLYEPKNKEGILMYDPSGNMRRVPHKNKKDALKEGYRTP